MVGVIKHQVSLPLANVLRGLVKEGIVEQTLTSFYRFRLGKEGRRQGFERNGSKIWYHPKKMCWQLYPPAQISSLIGYRCCLSFGIARRHHDRQPNQHTAHSKSKTYPAR